MPRKSWINTRFRANIHITKDKHPRRAAAPEENKMIYRFTKDGKTYTTAQGKNRFEAQLNIELSFQTDLTGATFEEVWKGKVDRTGIVK